MATLMMAATAARPHARRLPAFRYFLTPMFLFLSLRYGFLHFLHLVAAMSFLHPHLKQIFMTRRAVCAMRFFSGSVMGMYA